MCDMAGPKAPTYVVAQEREFYKYFQPLALGLTSRLNVNHRDHKPPAQPHASPDRALTSFAQLAAVRLNCKRSFISFFDRQHQFIVAEATRTLPLDKHLAPEAGDEIKYGATIVPRSGSVCEYTVSMPVSMDSGEKDVSVFVVPDCQKDDRFKSGCYTTDAGFRFYAGVAIVSPEGYRIGSFCVVDDKPRGGFSNMEISFLKDMATTVMVHMDLVRARSETVKGEKMVRGLGSFVEGKSSIEEWWMRDDGHAFPKPANPAPPIFVPANEWADRQYSLHHDGDTYKPGTSDNDNHSERDLGILLQVENDDRRASQDSSDDPVKPISENPKAKETSKQDTLSVEVKATFARAARIIREALRVDGVCCFDAKAGHTFGGLIDQDDDEHPKHRKPNPGPDDETSENKEHGSPMDPDSQDNEEDDKACEVLGFSTTEYSSIHGDQSSKVTDGMTENFLRSLLRRFPYGKILNFDENGASPSEEDHPTQERSDLPQEDKSKARRNKGLHNGEAKFIRKVFPGVRSLAIVPLWDSHQRFFSGCVAWTRSAYRILTPASELSYLAAFGDSIMAEVSRVDAKIADKAKSDFISSISHELRSPLHGILGSVECLQDSELDAFQENLVHTVETCGKTLLDTIDHLLDFAKINNFTRKGGKNSGKNQKIALDVDVDLSVVTEEVLETVFAGHDFLRGGSSLDSGDGPNTSSATSVIQRTQDLRKRSLAHGAAELQKKAVSVVVDINKAEESHWIFRTQAGAWRRILMNLFGNSLKYTESGFVQVKLDAVPLPREGKAAKSTVILTVIDSGKGIADDYLEKSLFVPFAQEDSLQPGTGLGLAITAAIIRGMGGEIEVRSEKGHGTEIKVTLDMIHAPYSQESLEQSIISSAARKTKNLKIGFVGFEADSFKEQPSTESRSKSNARHKFMSSFHRLCQNWFGMEMSIMHDLDQAGADIFLTTEQGLAEIQDQLDRDMNTQSDKDAQNAVAATPLLVLCNSATTANAMLHSRRASSSGDIAEYISQPCGPRKLAKSLVLCLERLEASRDPSRRYPTPHEVLGNDTEGEVDPKDQNSPGSGTSREDESKAKTDDPRANDPPLKHPHSDTAKIEQGGRGAESETRMNRQTVLPKRPSTKAVVKNPRTVLLVDDNKINLQLLVTYIRKTGHDFVTAGNGKEALEAYRRQCESADSTDDGKKESSGQAQTRSPFDFVLMDLSMPVMDGLESTRHIRAYERSNNIKPTTVIALTGLASASAQQEAYGSGINTFMTKPVKLKALGTLLEQGAEDDDNNEGKDDKKDEKSDEKDNGKKADVNDEQKVEKSDEKSDEKSEGKNKEKKDQGQTGDRPDHKKGDVEGDKKPDKKEETKKDQKQERTEQK